MGHHRQLDPAGAALGSNPDSAQQHIGYALVYLVQFMPYLPLNCEKNKQSSGHGDAIAQWIRLHLPFCGPGFDPQARHLCVFNLYLNGTEKRTKINKTRLGLDHFYKKYRT